MKKSGFTLVEILIVVIILGILAAIVIPQFTQASNDARTNSLASDLQTVRSQIQLFRVQHLDNFPSSDLVNQMMSRSDQLGNLAALTADPNTYPLGPYLQKFPTNAFADNSNVKIGDPAGTGPEGWDYNPATGAFYANTPAHAGM